MKNAIKKTVAFCGGALILIASCLGVMGLTQQTAYAAEMNNQKYEEIDYYKNANNFEHTIFSGLSFNGFNGIKEISAYSSFQVNSLLGSSIYGEWDTSFKKYNCYAFALGRTSKFDIIGEFSNNKITANSFGELNYSIQELSQRTVKDLQCLGYECVTAQKNWFYAPYAGQTLICVRKSNFDFHFMKYVNGDWLHKPGSTWILKYNGVPNAETDWFAEGAYLSGGVTYFQRYDSTYSYTGDIYFIKYANSHNYSTYTYFNAEQHEVKCNNCGSITRKEQHIFVPVLGTKLKRCKKCYCEINEDGFGPIIKNEEEDKQI